MKQWVIINSVIATLLFSLSSHAQSKLNVLTSFPPSFYQTFEKAFENKYPHIDVHFRNKKTTSGIKYLKRQSNHKMDVFWASAPDAFAILKASDLLAPIPDLKINTPLYLLNYPLHEKDQHYVGFALSGYGIMFNKSYLERHDLSIPFSWVDLAKPEYYSHLALSSPSRSGTTHLMIEMILQHYGWDQGWRTLLQMAGNIATITARSYVVPEGIVEQRFGLGMVIDFFAHKEPDSDIGFSYAKESSFLPASIAVLKGANNEINAVKFVEFVLSAEGQDLLTKQEIARLPINPNIYNIKDLPINPYMQEDKNTTTFDSLLSTQRYDLVNDIFDHFITFQLKTLQRLWGKIYTLEKKYKTTNDVSRLAKINQLKTSLSQLPIDQNIAQQTELSTLVHNKRSVAVEGFLPMPLMGYKQQWLSQLNTIELAIEQL